LQEVLGAGTVTNRSNSNACDYNVYDKATILKRIKLVNGKFRTPKVEALHRLIDWVNEYYSLDNPLPRLRMDTSNLGTNSWLAGYIECDGSFYLGYKCNPKGLISAFVAYLRISQRQNYHRDSDLGTSYYNVMSSIAEFLGQHVTIINRKRSNGQIEKGFQVMSGSLESNLIIVNYFK
jgi:LAGLIDADG endonuclease